MPFQTIFEFVDDQLVEGSITKKDGLHKEGKFIDQKLHGIGKLVKPSGEYQIGEWENGKRIGEHKVYAKEGNQRGYAYFLNDKLIRLILAGVSDLIQHLQYIRRLTAEDMTSMGAVFEVASVQPKEVPKKSGQGRNLHAKGKA